MTNTKNKKRVLVIGSKGHHGCDCIGWKQKYFPSAVDYHSIIINCTALPITFPRDYFYKNLKKLNNDLFNFLDVGHDLYVIADHNKTVNWSPFPIIYIQRAGEHIEKIQENYKEYFKYVNQWLFELASPSTEKLTYLFNSIEAKHPNILHVPNFKFEILACNAARNAISAIQYYTYIIKVKDFRQTMVSNTEEIDSGKFIILQPPQKEYSQQAIDFILTDLIEKYKEFPPPKWLENYSLPIKGLLEKQGILEKKMQKAIETYNKISYKIEEINAYRKLLYETGKPLENIIKKALEFIGISVIKPKYTKADHCIFHSNLVYLIEAKGKKDSINVRDVRQLTDHVSDWECSKQSSDPHCKGVFIGNPWREIEPKNRNEPPFTPDAIRHANNSNLVLLTTIFLYEIVSAKLAGKKIDTNRFLSDLSLSVGEFSKSPQDYLL
jgi:hypothetical protein